MMNADALRREHKQIKSELKGISPKLSIHAQMTARMREIEHLCPGELDFQDAPKYYYSPRLEVVIKLDENSRG